MMVFPFRRPSIGLSIGARTLSLVEIRRGWGPSREGIGLRRCSERALPDGLIRLSAAEPNVSDVPALARELRALLGSERSASVALTLPDLCTRVALLDFEALPPKTADRDRLLRWRFQKDFNMPAADLRLSYQVFRTTPPRVLAVGVRNNIVGQYERACEEAGLLPITVGVTSPRLFDLCRPVMHATMASGASGAGELFFLHVAEDSFSLCAFRNGCPVFLRTKLLHNGGSSDPATLAGEVLATLQFYGDSYPLAQAGLHDVFRPLFVVGVPPTCQVLDPGSTESMRIKAIPIGWDHVPLARNGRGQALPDARPLSGLPALAGLLEA
jgi:hypothetical protein